MSNVFRTTISIFVFFSRYGDHRALHSFPTRRSSDLATAFTRRPVAESRFRHLRGLPVLVHGVSRRAWGLRLRRARSEEHTSELQSQSNLVCRLLLEKKK